MPTMDTRVTIATFDHQRDKFPKIKTLALSSLAIMLTKHTIRPDKDGPLWSPVSYLNGSTRSIEGVDKIYGYTADIDDGKTPEDFDSKWGKYTHFVHSSFSHSQTKSKFRAFFPFAKPVSGAEWSRVWLKLTLALAPDADPSCCDVSRGYFLPSCPGDAKDFAFGYIHEGELLDPDTFEDVKPPKPSERKEKITSKGSGQGLPGDDFDERVSWDEICESHGCEKFGTWGAYTLWTRPDKDVKDGCSFRTGIGRAGDRLVNFSSSTPFPIKQALRKWHALAYWDYNGDFASCAKALYKLGYGNHLRKEQVTAPTEQEVAEKPSLYWQPCTDLGNCERLLDWYGDNLRYCHPFKRFLIWDGTRFEIDARGEAQVMNLCQKIARAMYIEGSKKVEGEDEEQIKRRVKFKTFARATESKSRLENMIGLVKKDIRVSMAADDFDRDHWKLNVINGTIDLRDGKLHSHDREDLITKRVEIFYDETAEAPVFKKFVLEIMGEDAEVARFLHRAIGYSLTGDVREHCVFFLHGGGSNGKGTLMRLLLCLLGDYFRALDSESLMMSKNVNANAPTPEIAKLRGTRLVSAPETPDGKRLDEAKLKQLTGGDRITACEKYGDPFEFDPTHKFWISGNHKPEIKGTDHGIWRRICLIPFGVTFGSEMGQIPIDPLIEIRMAMELPGILRWAVDGCRRWQDQGLNPPESVRQAVAEYRSDMDLMGEFLRVATEKSDAFSVSQKELHKAHKKWADETGNPHKSSTKLGREMVERGEKKITVMGVDRFKNLNLIGDYAPDYSNSSPD